MVYRTNPAIGSEDRAVVARALHIALCSDQLDTVDQECKGRLRALTVVLQEPGAPLVSFDDVKMLVDLIKRLDAMELSKPLDHPWGYVKRTKIGYLVAPPHDAINPGAWHRLYIVEVAQSMYLSHLHSRGLIPGPGPSQHFWPS